MALNDFLAMAKEPRVPDAPRRVWRDWVLVGALIPTAIAETLLRPTVVWPVFSLVWCVGLVLLLLWRRTQPLAVTVAAFGSAMMVSIVSYLAGVGDVGLYTMAALLVFPYAAARWGSGRELLLATVVMIGAWLSSAVVAYSGLGDLIGGFIVMMFPLELGALVRYQVGSRQQQIERAKVATRQQLARELHDTVAHHVSAIAIQAQGGRALAATKPETAAEVLATIEEEASRALTEMRNMVGALRDDDADDQESATLTPQPGVADISRLADVARPDSPRIEVQVDGDLAGLRPAVETALYRLAQESVTNAVRHARNPSRILVRIVGCDDSVRLTVEDDGIHNPAPSGTSGFGLVGMIERVSLLGGSIDAGPSGTRGWTVDAVLPRSGQGVTA
ncbi:MAG: sensor histidine kinase [Acidimicrobiia bacterium]|nr:sensor histidine kinase [Acidimicrobiia bacterium]